MKITFANTLADLCERIPGGNVDTVTDALGTDHRIGKSYLKGAIGYGGPCFPRDNVALSFVAQNLGMRFELAEKTDSINRSLPMEVSKRLQSLLKKGDTIAVLGLAYKPFSHVVEESQGLFIAKILSKVGFRVIAYDPLANETARVAVRDHVVVLDSVQHCLEQADAVLITTPDPVFKNLTERDFTQRKEGVVIVDFWRILEREFGTKSNGNVYYFPIGFSKDDQGNADSLNALWGDTGSRFYSK